MTEPNKAYLLFALLLITIGGFGYLMRIPWWSYVVGITIAVVFNIPMFVEERKRTKNDETKTR